MKLISLFWLLLLFCAYPVPAQQTGPEISREDLQKRLIQMEAQMELMRGEITKLKQSLSTNEVSGTKVNFVDAAPVKTETEKQIVRKNETPATQKQTGVDVGPARVTPYGTIYFNAFGNSGGTNNADVPLFAAPTGTGNSSAGVRQTRLGLRIEGAKVGNARLGAVIEADFFGGFPAVGIGENFGVVRLRLANARADWEKTSLTIGQDWMPFAPVNPVSLAAAAIPQMAGAGNNWARIPQIRLERKLGKNFNWQGAVLAPQTGDHPAAAATFFLQPNSGAASRLPFFQSRIAASGKDLFGTKKPGVLGFAAHYGRSRIFTGPAAANVKNDIDSLGVALDWSLPLAARLSFAGEAFFGRNLGGFQAGIFQSYNPDFALRTGNSLSGGGGGARAIETRGGWMQLGFTPPISKDRLALYGSVGIDDPRDEDLISTTGRDFRSQNFVYSLDAIYKFTPQFSFGAEFRRIQTDYLLSGRKKVSHINLGAAYSF